MPHFEMIHQEWNKAKWVFEVDGSLRDIYINDVTLDDWVVLVNFFNSNYLVNYSTPGNTLSPTHNPIKEQEIIKLLNDTSGELESKTVSIFLGDVMINCHFFSLDQIELDVSPKQIKSHSEFELVMNFMNDLSKVLDSEVILTGENSPEYPLITIEHSEATRIILTKSESYERTKSK